jgi:hypothetical protein
MLPIAIEDNTTDQIMQEQERTGEGLARMLSSCYSDLHKSLS